MVPSPALEKKVFFLTFLIVTVIHLSLIGPLSKWLDRSLLPRLADQSLEIDLYEIQSNVPPLKKTSTSPPEPLFRKQKEQVEELDKTGNLKKPLEQVFPEKLNELRLIPQNKIPLNTQMDKDLNNEDIKEALPTAPVNQALPTAPVNQAVTGEKSNNSSVRNENITPLLSNEINASQQVVISEKTVPEEKSVHGIDESPLFIKKKQLETGRDKKNESFPDEIKGTIRGGKPEVTQLDNLQYSMNSYQWTFERFIENWVVDIQKWWKAPLDYITGEMPEGGSLWVQVHLSLSGKLLSYKVIQSDVTSEMELMAIQALIGSLKRPELPQTFHSDKLIINWRFIYPSLRPALKMRR